MEHPVDWMIQFFAQFSELYRADNQEGICTAQDALLNGVPCEDTANTREQFIRTNPLSRYTADALELLSTKDKPDPESLERELAALERQHIRQYAALLDLVRGRMAQTAHQASQGHPNGAKH